MRALPRPIVDNRHSFFEFTKSELEAFFEALGEPRFRADQLFVNVYQRRNTEFSELSELP